MFTRRVIAGLSLAATIGIALASSAQSKPAPGVRKPDLGDAVQGAYFGDVISDSTGSSKSDVALTVTRVGKNLVQISSDYPRLPMVTVHLERAMDKIVNGRGDTAFVYDRAKSPAHLDVSFHNEVSWSGERR